jgi:ubiquinone/menaquinone biosynthesis C-methylase UbiE
MQLESAGLYRCPYTGEALELRVDRSNGSDVLTGRLTARAGRSFPIVNGVPFLIDAAEEIWSAAEKREYDYYQATSKSYDHALGWMFQSFYEDEQAVRNRMIDQLELQPNHRVLETGCGTCRDSIHIARRLGAGGELYMQDLSGNMVEVGRQRLAESSGPDAERCKTEFFVGNASYLPFPDGCFDAAYHFGGLNLFTDKKRALAEMTRVVRLGGKIVVGDEGLAPWHRDTEYGGIVTTANKMYLHHCPLECLPENARNVSVRWHLGNAFYVIEYRVGAGHPKIDLDLPIPGKRGGSYRSRYFGVLEGVSVETKERALKAAERSGLSVHDWLDQLLRREIGSKSEAA